MLRDQCIKLYHKKELEYEQQELVEADKFVIKAKRLLNEMLDKEDSRFTSSSVCVDYTPKMCTVKKQINQCIIRFDDLKFIVTPSSIRLLMTCSKCNEEYYSQEVGCKAEIGYQLELDPKILHTCKSQLQPRSAAERLEELIREIASSEV